mgnify:CR=1 FL=1
MTTYQLVAKYDGELDSEHVTFTATDIVDAISKARQWNHYHGHRDYPGYGWQVATEAPAGTEPKYNYMFKHQVN